MSAETKFTPGEWFLSSTGGANINGHFHSFWEVASAEYGVSLCVLPKEDANDTTRAMCQANAHLISAAPEMYKALEPFAAFLDVYETRRGLSQEEVYSLATHDGFVSITVAQMQAARAALAKARGEA